MEYSEQGWKEDDDKTVLLRRPAFGSASYNTPSLVYEDGRHTMIRQFPFLMGKMKSRVDEVIDGEGISRIHAMLKEQDGRYFLSDLNSLNGTGVNGRMLEANETVEICNGDTISLAQTALTFQC
jgi:pSer/pThr/pTyr-binding forkhead associated (FHA) protein